MIRRRHCRRRNKASSELDITSFLNLMVVLVPFLLISAVFSRVSILELSVPTAAGGSRIAKPYFTIEVVVRRKGLELANGVQVVATLPKKDGDYDLQTLSEMLVRLKKDYPEKDDATVLMEPDIEYDALVRVMDTVRQVELPDEEGGEVQKLVLFPVISIGDAS